MSNLVVYGCIVSNNAIDLTIDQSRRYRIALFTAVCLEQPEYLDTAPSPVPFEIFAETADLSIGAASGGKDYTDKSCSVIFLSKPAVEVLISNVGDGQGDDSDSSDVTTDHVSLVIGTAEYCLAQLQLFAMMMHEQGNSGMLKRLLYMMREVTNLKPEEMMFISAGPNPSSEVVKVARVVDMFNAALESMASE